VTDRQRPRLALHLRLPARAITVLAKAGYAARGVVYLIIGSMAFLAAFGASETPDTRGALRQVLHQPFGEALVWVLVVGLLGYALWRLVQSLLDTDDHGLDPRGLAVRAGLLASAGTYAALAVYCLSMLGLFADDDPGEGAGTIGRAMSELVGARFVALGLAAIFTGMAGAHFWKALRRKYAPHFHADAAAMRVIHPVSITGLIARGLVFAVIAVLLGYRFLSADGGDSAPPDIRDALAFVQDLPFGQWLLAALGLGLVAFAAYSFIEAVWRRINVRDGFE